MRLLARLGLMGLVVLVGRPMELFAKPKPPPMSAEAEFRASLARDGFTVLEVPKKSIRLGDLYSADNRLQDACVALDKSSIRDEAMGESQSETNTARGIAPVIGIGPLQAGMRREVTRYKFTDVMDRQHRLVPQSALVPSQACQQLLNKHRSNGVDLNGWYVIQETVSAFILEITCDSKEEAIGIQAELRKPGFDPRVSLEADRSDSCFGRKSTVGVIGYKTSPATELLADLAPPPVRTPVEAPPSVVVPPPAPAQVVARPPAQSAGVVAALDFPTMALPSDGSIAGRLSAGDDHACGVTQSGSVKCWGKNESGQATPPSGSFQSVSAGWGHTCGVTQSGSVKCWGKNESGQATPPSGSFQSVSVGGEHTCGLTQSGSVKCWGAHLSGRTKAPSGVYQSVSAGGGHTCGVKLSGRVKCWGDNLYFQRRAPSGVFRSVSAGNIHTCGVTQSGGVKCWGYNRVGQSTAPSGTFSSVSAGNSHTCGLTSSGAVKCWGENGWQQSAPHPGPFVSVSVGEMYTCGVQRSGAVKCWGYNYSGQTNVPADLLIPTD